MTSEVREKRQKSIEPEEDIELKSELQLLIDRVMGDDPSQIKPSLDMLKFLIRTSTTSMTSVPKPLKYLALHYEGLKNLYEKTEENDQKKHIADVISLLAMGTAGGEQSKADCECLKYCLLGTMKNIGDFGHEYIRQLEKEIVQKWIFNCETTATTYMPLIHDITVFDCAHHAELQACDLLMEIDMIHLLPKYITNNTYKPICMYLTSCAKYVDDSERSKIMKIAYDQYLRFKEFSNAMIVAIQMKNQEQVLKVFDYCNDKVTSYQLAFICARHMYMFPLSLYLQHYNDLDNILSNAHLNGYFLQLARELDIVAPKSPEEVYKTWLEPTVPRLSVLGENVDSAKQNLASSLVNGFINAGFGSDKLLTADGGNSWIFRNKEHGMLSATAALGLLHLWDIDGGLTPIDKYLYSTDKYIKSGALLALGIVNCRVRNECDPALALLGDYINCNEEILQLGAILGIGLAYIGTNRSDVLNTLLPLITPEASIEVFGIASLACGLISLGQCTTGTPSAIFEQLITLSLSKDPRLKSPHVRMACLGLGLCYMQTREAIETANATVEVLEEPFRTFVATTLLMCAYAGSGDVLKVQQLLHVIGEKDEEEPAAKDVGKKGAAKEATGWSGIGKAVATIAVAVVAMGEDIGTDMINRIFGQVLRYGDPSVRRVVPLSIALASVSNPQLSSIDVLTKYSHDQDTDVSSNAIFGLGLIGAGTNNARLAATLRQLAVFHHRNPSQLFMVRVAQGLVHLGKGTLTLNPMHTDRMLMDPVALTGLLSPVFALLDPESLILNQFHYLLYLLSAAMQPRWLLTLDDTLNTVPVTVRVGQAVDVIGKAGTPKTIAGIHTHMTPVLLATAERAELATDQYDIAAPTLDGICVLKKVPEVKSSS